MSFCNSLPWIPPSGTEAELLPAGHWWDALRVPVRLGGQLLRRLGDTSGAVIEDRSANALYWLVQPGSADHWQLPGVRVIGRSARMRVPPRQHTHGPGLHWRVPVDGVQLTEPEVLHGALLSALTGSSLPPRRAPLPPLPCLGQDDRDVHACPACLPHCWTGAGRQDESPAARPSG